MQLRSPILFATALGLLSAGLLSDGSAAAQPPAAAIQGLPRVPPEEPLPPLPAQSPRNANYTIAARLDPEKHMIEGRLVLEWRNLGDKPVDTFPFHLYWNAFRNNLST